MTPGPEQQRWAGRPSLNKPFITNQRIITSLTSGKLRNFVTGKDYVWVTTYHKSGTMWVQKIVISLISDPKIMEQYMISMMLVRGQTWHTTHSRSDDELITWQPATLKTCWKSYWPRQNHMADPLKRVIYVMRNVMDVAVNFYHHTFNLKFLYNFDDDFDEFFDFFVRADVEIGNWFDHVVSWCLLSVRLGTFLVYTYLKASIIQ